MLFGPAVRACPAIVVGVRCTWPDRRWVGAIASGGRRTKRASEEPTRWGRGPEKPWFASHRRDGRGWGSAGRGRPTLRAVRREEGRWHCFFGRITLARWPGRGISDPARGSARGTCENIAAGATELAMEGQSVLVYGRVTL